MLCLTQIIFPDVLSTLYCTYFSFDIDPPLTRGEIRELWETVLTNKDGTLSWLEFIRQFGFTGQTHTYPDAGRNPPKWGDSDYSLRSRKFNSDTEILVDGTKQKVAAINITIKAALKF